jgi:hypothetical protein
MDASDTTGSDWLTRLPFWAVPQARAAFVADVACQLGCLPDADACASTLAAERAAAFIHDLLGDPALPAAARVVAASVQDLGAGHLLPRALQVMHRPSAGALPALGCPYPGLRPFRAEEAGRFFGRGQACRRLRRLLAEPLPLPVLLTGPPASGKTSLLHAGILAARAGPAALFAPGCGDGADVAALAAALRPALAASGLAAPDLARVLAAGEPALSNLLAAVPDPPEPVLIIADGLEQLLGGADADATAVLRALGALAALPGFEVVVCLSAEALGACLAEPALCAAIEAGRIVTLAAPSADLLAWMLGAPLTPRSGATARRWSEAAARALATEAAAAPLPLLHLAARAPALYQAALAGGDARLASVPDPFGASADAALAALDAEAVAALPRVLAPLVVLCPTGAPACCRPVASAHWQADPAARRLIAALLGAAPPLLRRLDAGAGAGDGDGDIALAHPGLLRVWPALARWLDRRRDADHLRVRIEAACDAWRRAGRGGEQRWPHEQLEPARALLAEAGLLAALEQDADLAEFLTPEPSRLIAELAEPTVGSARREDIGLRLAHIGDPRPGVLPSAGVPAPRWCALPAGTVMLAGRRAVNLVSFAIAAVPVTQAQFQAFLTAPDGYRDPRCWPNGRVPPPSHAWDVQQRANYPVTQVSRRDAEAFCRWLTRRLGYEVRLPDEGEWQWAAQSAQEDFLYPWGPDWLPGCANTDEAGIGRTLAVGLYPQGASRQGVCDLAGNIWEWCRGGFDQAGPAPAATGVIRGGSWRVNRGFARADFRIDSLPEERLGSTGFRLASAAEQAIAAASRAEGPRAEGRGGVPRP